MKKYIEKMTGYKATNADMTCKGDGYSHTFELGKWYEFEGEIELCNKGFHFCIHASGPLCYYSQSDSRVFKIEAEQILDLLPEPGADYKLVAKRIRLVEEITPGKKSNDKSNLGNSNTGNSNTGDSNTGYRNTGDRNTGDRNTGDSNTGNWNAGDRNAGNWNAGYGNTGNRNTGDNNTGNSNTGYRNTGYRNTGNKNTGDSNTGDSNTGDSNTGDSNTGNSNTGDRNTGYRNTGDNNTGDSNTGYGNTGNWNAGDRCSGFFCLEEPKALSFGLQTKLTHSEFLKKYPQSYRLGELIGRPEPINFDGFKMIPGITKKKLSELHKKYLAKIGSK